MPIFFGTAASETITPGFVSAGVLRFPAGSFPGAGVDTLFGGGGNDSLDAGGGNDVLSGDDGNDTLRGNTGADVLNGGNGTDTATYSESAAGVNVSLTNGLGFGGSAAGDTLLSIENLTGSNFADTLTGNALANVLNGLGGNDVLNGFGGNDVLSGGDGNDTLNGGTGVDNMNGGLGNDLYIVDNVGDIAGEVAGGIDTVQSSVTHALSVNMENLTLTGAGVINGTGNANANVITGNSANNVLSGLDGNDTLFGLAGNDTMSGDSGNDSMNGGLGDDFLEGDLGTDTLTGGGGLDTFDFDLVTESLPGVVRDVITDFVGNGIFVGDVIDVTTIDADTSVFAVGDQDFTFIGGAAFNPFNATAQLRYAGGVLQGSTDVDAFAEFEIALTGAPALVAADIVL